MRLIVLSLLLLTASCGRESSNHAAPPVSPPSGVATDQRLAVPEALAGEYRVAGVDGQPLDASFGIAISIDAETISYDPRCAGFVWSYRYENGSLETGRPSGPAQAVCEIAMPPELTQLAGVLDSAERARRTPENGIEISGAGRSVTLFSQ